MTVAAPNLSKLLPAAPPGNLLLLPQVARAALFAAFPGPAVLLTTPDRLRLHVAGVRHGREVCLSRHPRCDACVLADLCPSAALLGPG